MKWTAWGLAAIAAVALSAACGDDEPAKSSGPTCPDDNPECKEIATIEAGQLSVSAQKRNCVKCHGDNMAGRTTPLEGFPPALSGEPVELYPPNLTADPETGVAPPEKGGKWTDDALALAIRTGIDEDSQALCPQMKHFSEMSDFEVYSIVKYLRSIPPVKQQVPRSVCYPTKTKEQQNQPR